MSLVVPFKEIFEAETKLLAKHSSWKRVELGEVCEILNGCAFKSALFNKREGLPVVRIRDLARGRTETFYNGDYSPEYIVENGALLIGMDGNFGCYEWSGGTALLNQRVCKIIPHDARLHRKFLLFGINGYLKAIQDSTSSVTVGHLSSRDIQKIPFPLPPINEQRRIVAKLEKLLSRVDAAQARLATIPRILKRFRQSVLAAACSGRLTADWREQNPYAQSTFELMELIKSKRKQKKPVEPVDSDAALDEIPDAWTWVRFGSVIDQLRNGISTRPDMEPPGTPILRINAARPGRIDLDEVRFLKDGSELLREYRLKDRDLLFTRYNGSLELLGVCGMVRALGKRVRLYPDKLMRVRFDHDFVLPEYTEIFFQAPSVHERVIAKSKSSAGQNGISGSDIKGQPFALPPLAEQQEIVSRVEALFKTADALEARYLKAKANVDKLTQSILAKAFRGELVPQDPNDEPASVLLERIQEREKTSDKKVKRRK